uniref:poly(A)-specific ribonuclease PARN-like n=1 Tax=Ziziphus jujuba TaxID=326968 RepID=A0A6P6GG21_ZIZJJ
MVSLRPLLQRRCLCTKLHDKWSVKQVMKSNFAESLEEIKTRISDSDFIAVSLQKTGSFSARWQRVLPFDTAETAYCKAKYAAEKFQLLQFAVCPFTISDSKLVAHPYNFLLFPRDEMNIGMPSYSFSCQTSYLTSMAQEGFDFNACIYDGISYLSRVQESAAKVRIGNPTAISYQMNSSSTPTVADAVFVERIKSRIKNWKNSCKSSNSRTDDPLVSTLRKLITASEFYGSRPSMSVDVCSERQVQLVLEMLREFSDELVPLIIPAKSGGTQAVCVVLTSSKEDKNLFEMELHCQEEEQNKKVRGFREVIDLISASQKPVVSHNFLNDFTFIHSKFIGPLPPNIDEFASSLRLVFPVVLDVSYLMQIIGPLRKVTNIPVAISYLNNRFFAPVDIEIPHQATENEGKLHGYNVVRICHLFAKLCSVLKIPHSSTVSDNEVLPPALEEYTNVFNEFPASTRQIDEDVKVWMKNTRKVSCEQLVLLWGFRSGMTAGKLKSMLHRSHDVFSEEFDVRLVDKSCAIVVFWQPGLSTTFLDVMNGKEVFGALKEMISEGLRAVSFEAYKKVCRLGIWEADLTESLVRAMDEDPDYLVEANPETKLREIYWSSHDSMINLDEL